MCNVCKEILPLTLEYFNKRIESYSYTCKTCNKNRCNINNKQQSVTLDDYFLRNICAVCGESDPNKLTVDHINPEKKPRNAKGNTYSCMVRMPFRVMVKDLDGDNTQPLCASCHMLKTREENGNLITPENHAYNWIEYDVEARLRKIYKQNNEEFIVENYGPQVLESTAGMPPAKRYKGDYRGVAPIVDLVAFDDDDRYYEEYAFVNTID